VQAFVALYLRGKKLYGDELWRDLVDTMEDTIR
jgi:hypothetical protein